MSPLLDSILLRQIPDHLAAGVSSGDYKVYGSIIRSVSQGGIVGHLQETSALSSMLGKGVFGLPELAGQAVSIVQNEQIKAAVSVVQSLQLANLAVGVATIGVSVAGTALLALQIRRVEAKVDELLPQLDALVRGVDSLRRERIAEDFTRLRTLADLLDECWLLAGAAAEWRAIARDAHFLADSFERRTRELFETMRSDRLAGEPFTEGFALASSLRITARLAAGDDEAARKAAESRVEILRALGTGVQLAPLVLQSMSTVSESAGTEQWRDQLDRQTDQLRPLVVAARHREISAAATNLTLDEIHRQGIAGRDWLDAARSEHENPLLFLPSSS